VVQLCLVSVAHVLTLKQLDQTELRWRAVSQKVLFALKIDCP
jgi:hypothetical protein